jgi:hypothetical protein
MREQGQIRRVKEVAFLEGGALLQSLIRAFREAMNANALLLDPQIGFIPPLHVVDAEGGTLKYEVDGRWHTVKLPTGARVEGIENLVTFVAGERDARDTPEVTQLKIDLQRALKTFYFDASRLMHLVGIYLLKNTKWRCVEIASVSNRIFAFAGTGDRFTCGVHPDRGPIVQYDSVWGGANDDFGLVPNAEAFARRLLNAAKSTKASGPTSV